MMCGSEKAAKHLVQTSESHAGSKRTMRHSFHMCMIAALFPRAVCCEYRVVSGQRLTTACSPMLRG
eukprot:5328090-Amphidinium_carterae.4